MLSGFDSQRPYQAPADAGLPRLERGSEHRAPGRRASGPDDTRTQLASVCQRFRRSVYCRQCKKTYQSGWYEKNRERHKANVAAASNKQAVERRALIAGYKEPALAPTAARGSPPCVWTLIIVATSAQPCRTWRAGMRLIYFLQKSQNAIWFARIVIASTHRQDFRQDFRLP